MFAVILAAILSFYYISRYRTLNDKFSLFLGIGFLANASIDLLHVIVSYNLINEPLFLKYFIPQTWFAGRLFLSAMFAMAIAGYPILSRKEDSNTSVLSIASAFRSRKTKRVQQLSPSISEQGTKEEEQERKERESRHNRLQQKMLVVFLAILAGVAATSAISSLFVVFPGIVLDNYPLHRPYEIPPLILFLAAGL
jgi:hypothetical protein